MYPDLAMFMGIGLFFGLLSLICSIAIPAAIAIAVLRSVARQKAADTQAGQAPPANLDRLIIAAMAAQSGRLGTGSSGQPGPAETAARGAVINAGIDPTPRP